MSVDLLVIQSACIRKDVGGEKLQMQQDCTFEKGWILP